MSLGGGIAGQRDTVAVQAELDALDLIGREVVLAPHRDQRVDRGMGIAAARIGFYADLHGSRRSSQARRPPCRDVRVGVAGEQAVLAFDRFRRAEEIFARQRRGDNAVHRGSANLEVLVPGAVDEEL